MIRHKHLKELVIEKYRMVLNTLCFCDSFFESQLPLVLYFLSERIQPLYAVQVVQVALIVAFFTRYVLSNPSEGQLPLVSYLRQRWRTSNSILTNAAFLNPLNV